MKFANDRGKKAMKHLRSLLLSMAMSALFFPSTAVAQGSLSQVTSALGAGNASALASFFEGNIELTIGDEDGAYSKAQAEQIVKSFFTQHQPKSFKKMHESSTGGNSQFAVGTLTAASGSFRVDIFYKTNSGKLRIQRLKFTES